MHRILLTALAVGLAATTSHAETFRIPDRDAAALVAAIEKAESTREPDRIELAPDGLYVFRSASDRDRALALPYVRTAITIVGNGAEIRRYSDQEFALVGVASTGKLALENIGLAEAGRGAIVNRGVLHLDRVRVTDSTADGANAIVTNYGTLRGADSEISFNAVLAAQRDAGILVNYGRLELARSRMAGNTVTGRRGSVMTASAMLNLGDASFRDVKIEGNSAVAEPIDTTRAHAVVNVGNGALHGEGIQLVGNFPEEANALPAQDPDSMAP
ncbi:hypothetical protein [Tahibacter amnicola]|uniref:Parallel beta helix pectate lyase-like protein n=1 Tax=Tahibacter amnicola TaxID=2976241 RepID=A0ABY6BNS2_9GAMM|nr:hypothetical protein [Tahibacter amnicola]UXI69447.1 hypothetical protein N4264_07305 [Tahibacter amnicola]